MSAPRIVRNVVSFVREFLARDRYMVEAGAAVVTFVTGVLIMLSIDAIGGRPALIGFTEMPCPEFWVSVFALPGLVSAIKLCREGERHEGRVSFAVMASFLVTCGISWWFDLGSWTFWMLFALQLGILKGFALVQEWTYLRWGVSCLGAYFWISLTLSIAQNIPWGAIVFLGPFAGFAAANLLCVSRLSGRRRNA